MVFSSKIDLREHWASSAAQSQTYSTLRTRVHGMTFLSVPSGTHCVRKVILPLIDPPRLLGPWMLQRTRMRNPCYKLSEIVVHFDQRILYFMKSKENSKRKTKKISV